MNQTNTENKEKSDKLQKQFEILTQTNKEKEEEINSLKNQIEESNRNYWIIERIMNFEFRYGKELDGILRYLSCMYGNIHEESIVNISGGSGLGNVNFTGSSSTQDKFIQFDFYEKRVKLTCYTIFNTNSTKLLHWKVLGSNNGDNWDIIDKRDLCSQSNDMTSYDVHCLCSYKYIRFLQTGPNSNGSSYFYYSMFEFFGELQYGHFRE